MSAEANEVQTTTQQKGLSGELEVLKPEIEKVLPEHVTADKFMRVVTTAIAQDPNLRSADRRSLLTSCVKAATDGLVPDGREAALVIFGGKVAYMPMTAGILKKVRNSGELKSIMSNVVYENDEFNYWIDDLGEHINHKPALEDRGNFLAVYAVAKTKDEGVYVEVMSRSQVEQVRNVSKAKSAGPWKDWYDEMARKTAIRRLSKRLPMSTDIEAVVTRDDQFYDFSSRNQAAQSGTAAAKQYLGLPNIPTDDGAPLDETAADGEIVDADTGEVQKAAIPQYDESAAIALLGAKRTIKTLDEAWDEIAQDFGDTGRELPQGVKDKYDARRAELAGAEE